MTEVIAALAGARRVEKDVLVARLEDQRIPMDLAAATGKTIPFWRHSLRGPTAVSGKRVELPERAVFPQIYDNAPMLESKSPTSITPMDFLMCVDGC